MLPVLHACLWRRALLLWQIVEQYGGEALEIVIQDQSLLSFLRLLLVGLLYVT